MCLDRLLVSAARMWREECERVKTRRAVFVVLIGAAGPRSRVSIDHRRSPTRNPTRTRRVLSSYKSTPPGNVCMTVRDRTLFTRTHWSSSFSRYLAHRRAVSNTSLLLLLEERRDLWLNALDEVVGGVLWLPAKRARVVPPRTRVGAKIIAEVLHRDHIEQNERSSACPTPTRENSRASPRST